jgi:hypothetical protein
MSAKYNRTVAHRQVLTMQAKNQQAFLAANATKPTEPKANRIDPVSNTVFLCAKPLDAQEQHPKWFVPARQLASDNRQAQCTRFFNGIATFINLLRRASFGFKQPRSGFNSMAEAFRKAARSYSKMPNNPIA